MAATFAVAMMTLPMLGAGWFWDLGNAIGFAALAGLFYSSVVSSRPLAVPAHQLLGFTVLAITALHAGWFLVGDAAVVTYLKTDGPLYMWAGLGGVLLLIALTLHGLPEYRRKLHGSHRSFGTWHAWLATAVVALTVWHVIGSGHYLSQWYQGAVLLLIATYACFGRRLAVGSGAVSRSTTGQFILMSAVASLVFALIRNLPE